MVNITVHGTYLNYRGYLNELSTTTPSLLLEIVTYDEHGFPQHEVKFTVCDLEAVGKLLHDLGSAYQELVHSQVMDRELVGVS